MEKLVAANSFPYLEQIRNMSSGNPFPGRERSRDRVEYMFQNNGVGPARIDWVTMTFKGKTVANLSDLLAACCHGTASDTKGINRRGTMDNTLLRPGASLSMFTWDEPLTENPVFAALHRQMGEIRITSCYCSVFDECYIRRPTMGKPEPVKQCTAPPVAFQPGFAGDI